MTANIASSCCIWAWPTRAATDRLAAPGKFFYGRRLCERALQLHRDGDTEQWVKTLEAALQLGAKVICPGHGPVGSGDVLVDQQQFFVALRKEVKQLVATGKDPEEVKRALEDIKAAVKKNSRIERYLGDFFSAQVEKVYTEMGGRPFEPKTAAFDNHHQHALAHGRVLKEDDVLYRRSP
jgi:glyoxylase-like metal-dependent hydrolase (beta-lactamase superfamily II)